ncbi:MAG: FtsX-like permease family protein [Acidobacteria bacterium]|nr:FtsX-like permease family protein [Acidobacteriota bacterium]
MFLRLLRASLGRNRRRLALALAALALGTGVAAAALSVAFDVGDKLARELRSFGANLLVLPKADTLPVELGGVDLRPLSEGSFLREDDLPRLKQIFWRHHILAFAPYLYQSVQLADDRTVQLTGTWFRKSLPLNDGTTVETGLLAVHPSWQVEGALPRDAAVAEALVGRALAERLRLQSGVELSVGIPGRGVERLRVRGRLITGGPEEEQVFVPLAWLQEMTGRAGALRRLEVSALVSPDDPLARRDPRSMTPAEYDRWYCTPYVSSIAHQIQEALPDTEARVIRRVAQAESALLNRINRLLALVSLAALGAAALAMLGSTRAAMLERRREIALMKALGAGGLLLGGFFLTEAVLVGLVGGVLGYGLGLAGAEWIARSVFGTELDPKPLLVVGIALLGVLVALIGTVWSIRQLRAYSPATVLKEK